MEARYAPSSDRPPTLDLAERWLDVRRISRSIPAYRWCIAAGWDREDLDAEVMVRVLARQSMPSRYDPSRACLSKYLWTLCQGILLNLVNSHRHLGSPDELLDEVGSVDGHEDPEGLVWLGIVEEPQDADCGGVQESDTIAW